MTRLVSLLPLWAGIAFAQSAVQVEIFEKFPAGSEFALSAQQPLDRYSEPAFGFVHIPAKFSPNALSLDRSTPFVLRATFARPFPAGSREFQLRARGAAALWGDGRMVAKSTP